MAQGKWKAGSTGVVDGLSTHGVKDNGHTWQLNPPRCSCPGAQHTLDTYPIIELKFTATQTNGHHTQTETAGQPSLADIIREETDGGRLIIRFLVDAMRGNIDHVKPCHRLDAARHLIEHGYSDAGRLIDDNTLQSPRRAPSLAPATQSSSAPDDGRRPMAAETPSASSSTS